ncbi:MAG: IPT/TIG domain-containing protein [Prevotellaceae bacterium]|nr:IPT/TIG domain-containing protein [Prevotellaceae bacterium]
MFTAKKKCTAVSGISRRFGLAALAVIALGLAGCSEDVSIDDAKTVATAPPYDPSKPVLISDFTPKSGGVGQRIVIYGQNFGNDPSQIHVFIGGKEAVVIGVNGESLYCLVPEKAFSGDIKIRFGDDSLFRAEANTAFAYKRKMVVSTLCGYRNEFDSQGWLDGKFSEVTGFRNTSFMRYDPENPKHLWIAYDGNDLYLVNFEDSTVTRRLTRGQGNWDRLRSVDFTVDGKYMIISNDQGGENDISTSILSRESGFTDPQALTRYRQCNGAAIHPVNGELYFNSYERGQFYRFDIANSIPLGGYLGTKDYEELFKIQDNGWEYNIRIHPTGNYAYIVVINQHYILRTDYNWQQKKFMTPYVVAGYARSSGYVDGVGTVARLSSPWQGVFVKNPDYAGKIDEYDFYFTERDNHDIRILTPVGKVTTFAGRGSSSINTNPYGLVNGDLREEARFDQPTGLAYDEADNAFYICDVANRCMRKIAMEEETVEEPEPEED